jgi:putative chitinase
MSRAHAIDAEHFFPSVRATVFHKITQSQVDGMNIILAAWAETDFEDLNWLAYMLGTAYHETGATMQPIRERGGPDYFRVMYDVQGKRPAVARAMGNTHPGDGAKYCGRGFVQITWHNNYLKAGVLLGIDLVNNPDMAMVPEVAVKIMFEGMTRSDIVFENHQHTGPDFNFTGRTLEDYFTRSRADWVGARHIINGSDHAAMIAATAQDFRAALRYR